MDPLTAIAAATAAVKLIATIRDMVHAGHVKNDDGSAMTVEQFDAKIAEARVPVREGIDVAAREIGAGGPGDPVE